MSRKKNVILIGTCRCDVSEAVHQVVSSLPSCELACFADQTEVPTSIKPSVFIYRHANGQTIPEAVGAVRRLIAAYPTTPVLVISSNESSGRSEFIAGGAVDCLLFPLDANRLSFLLDLLTVRESVQFLVTPPELAPAPREGEFLANSVAMQEILALVDRVATLPVTLLLTGPTGTGKTYLARHIHRLSVRPEDRFLVMDCGAIPSTLMESELFGHVAGSFTGATSDHEGKFDAVGAGTLLLDEIDALPRDTQTRLLRVVEDREFEPLGSTQTKSFRGRLVVATNQNLEAAVAEGRFREDLYYRLNVIHIAIPPLCDRRDDILLLANAFLHKFSTTYLRRSLTLSDAASEALLTYDWPGNVRELRNVIERACALTSSVDIIDVGELPFAVGQSAPNGERVHGNGAKRNGRNKLALARVDAERSRLLESLRRHANNRSRVALDLGISRVTLYKKLRKFGLM